MSNEIKECLDFSSILPNQSITFCVFRHWFAFKIVLSCVFILSKINLLISKYVWHLKENNTDYTIKWSIIKNSISYTGGSKRCNLCLEEKLCILKEKSKYLLNKRSEIVSACHHKNKFQVNHLTKKGMHGI